MIHVWNLLQWEISSQFVPYSFPASSSDILLQSGEPVHYMLGNGAVNVDDERKALYNMEM